MTEDDIYLEIKKLADANGYQLTENAIKICAFRSRADIPLSKCPCEQNNPKRYCISELCKDDIERYGRCHCNCFWREKKDG